MPLYELDHLTLGVRHLYAGCERLRAETGLVSIEGGWQRGVPTAHRVVPLPGDAFLNVESVIDHHAALTPPEAAFRRWFDESVEDGEDRFMTWALRARTYDDLEGVARRFGSAVTTAEGAIRPNGVVMTHAMAPGGAAHPWLRGLPNWYFYADMDSHPTRWGTGEHRKPLHRIAWLEVGGEAPVYREHLGEETFESLPLRFVDRPYGLYGLGIDAGDGHEIAIRRGSAASRLPEIMAGLVSASEVAQR